MAIDNTVLPPGAGGDTIRDIDRGAGVKTQVVQLDIGGAAAETLVTGSIPVTGTFFQATQPVSGTFFQATQPVSGTVTANQGTAAALAGAWPAEITDGTNGPVAVKAASTAAIATDKALVVAISPNNSVSVTGTVTTTPPANASTNVAQVAGTATDVNSGLKSAGTIRVVLATDQPALTNKLLVTPDSVALPANQSVNVAQLAGTATTVNSGLKDAGTLRVVLATDQPALTNKLLVTPDSVALPANQSVNVAQVAATTLGVPTNFGTTPTAVVAMSANASLFIGTTVAVASSAGVQKVGISGNTGVSLDGAGGAAVPANAVQVAGGSIAGGTNLTVLTVKAASTAAAATDTSLVVQPLVGSAVMSTAAAGVQKVGVVGNAGAIFDGATAASVPANALLHGARAQNANPTAVTNGQMVAIATDLAGRLITTPLVYRTLVKHQATASAATTETTFVTAGAAGVFRDLTKLIITTVGALVSAITIRDVTAGGTPWIINWPTTAVVPLDRIILDFNPPLQQGTAASAWTFAQTAANALNITAVFVERVA